MQNRIYSYVEELQEKANAQFERAKRYIKDKERPDLEWLSQFSKEGKGLDMCCGDFPVAGAFGVDGAFCAGVLESGFVFANAESIPELDDEICNYIVSNYFDAMPNPLKALREWKRLLKRGGTCALICQNAESYSHQSMGPLLNGSRTSSFTQVTLYNYLARAGFTDIVIEKYNATLRVSCRRP